MNNFLNRHDSKLKNIALILMLVIPFFLYVTAMYGTIVQVKLILGLLGVVMLYVMKNG